MVEEKNKVDGGQKTLWALFKAFLNFVFGWLFKGVKEAEKENAEIENNTVK